MNCLKNCKTQDQTLINLHLILCLLVIIERIINENSR